MFKRHFRFNKVDGHPAYIISEGNGNYSYISITHAPCTLGKFRKNIALIDPIKQNDDRINYIVPVVMIAPKRHFSNHVATQFKFSPKDGATIRDMFKKMKVINKW